MSNIMDSLRMILLYNRLRFNIITFIVVPIIALPGIVYAEPITSKEYMYPIAFVAFSLIIFLFGLANLTGLITSKKFIYSSKVAKSSYTHANILYTNILGIGFICILSLTKYILSLFNIGSMDNIAATLFVLLVVSAFIGFLKVIIIFFNMPAFTLAALIALLVTVAARYSFEYFRFRDTLFYNNAGMLILFGILLFMTINSFSVLYAEYLYKNRKGIGSWISQEE